MNAAKGYYSLIQYCPDESRLEAINIGVVLFCPELKFLKARWSETSRARVRKALGNQDWHFFENQKVAVNHRLSDPEHFDDRESFARYAETRANAIRLSTPRPLKTVAPEKTVNDLFNRLVGESRQIQRAPRVARKLTQVLADQGILPLVKSNVEVSITKLGKTLKASYGYQNGRFNLVQPEQFGLSNDDQVFQKASRLAVEGKFIFDDGDPKLGESRLIVVGQFKSTQAEARKHVEEIFRKNDVGMYTFDHLDPLLADIRTNAEKHYIHNR